MFRVCCVCLSQIHDNLVRDFNKCEDRPKSPDGHDYCKTMATPHNCKHNKVCAFPWPSSRPLSMQF